MENEIIRSVDDVVLVRWLHATPEGVERAVALTDAVYRRHGLVTFIGLVGNEMSVPSETARLALMNAIDPMLKQCRSMNLAFDGTGMRFVAVRSAGAAMFLLKGDRRMKMYNSLHDALADRVPVRVDELLSFSRAEGMIPKLATTA